jgi:N-acylneuraminate cytidylyltransferase
VTIVGIVTARGGSRSVPRKNIAALGGRPLLAWTAEAALGSCLDRVVLSTDDAEIARIGAEHGLEVPFLRPAGLAGDSALSIHVMQHAITELADPAVHALMLLQPTTPLRTSADIDGAVRLFESTGADSVISVTDVDGHHPARMKWLEGDRLVDPPYAEEIENQPRQQLRPTYIRNGALYLTRLAVILAGSFKGADSRAWIMPPHRSVNIDGPFDLAMARAIVDGGLLVDVPEEEN